MRILITGATGLVGKILFQKLYAEGHDLVVLTRSPETAKSRLVFPCQIHAWNPMQEQPPSDAFDRVEAVVHLAGESIGNQRWTPELKKKIHDSRVLGTRNLVQALHSLKGKGEFKGPRILVSASAIGYYGSQGDLLLDETSPPSEDFLAQVCKDWETEALAFSERTVLLRTGVVLSPDGGALEKLLPVFKSGLGGQIGNGQDWMSWIHINDLVDLIYFCLSNSQVQGPVNAVAPHPVTNQEFTSALSRALGKSAHFRIPTGALKLMYGEMSSLILSSQRVFPKKALNLSFKFNFPELQPALDDICSHTHDNECVFQQFIPKPPQEVFAFFSQAGNLEQITPEWLGFKIQGKSTEQIKEGTLIDYRLKLHGLSMKWQTRIDDWNPNEKFVDRQTQGPYKKWVHSHSFRSVPGGTLMTDVVHYQLPGGILGKAVGAARVKNDLNKIFEYRKKKISDAFS